MMNSWQKVALASANVGLTLSLVANPVQAAQINFSVSIDSGPLNNQTFLGSLNFDESGLTQVGAEFLSVSQLTFNFFGSTFTEAFFAYEIISSDESGFGDVIFEQVPFKQVPEPTSVVGLLALSVLGLGVGTKRK